MTDITGFGLLGHAHEVAHLSTVAFRIDYEALPWLPGARRYAESWQHFPGGSERNEAYFGRWLHYERPLPDWEQRLLHDPQTSGGLLMAVPAARADDVMARLGAKSELAHRIGEAILGDGELVIS